MDDKRGRFEAQVLPHLDAAYRFARWLSRSSADADDVVQEATFHAFVNIGRFRKEARFSTWLIAIGVNSALGSKRKGSRVHWIYLDQTDETSREAQTWEPRDAHPTPEQECIDRELLELVQREMQKLPRPFRSVLQNRTLEVIGEYVEDGPVACITTSV